MYTVELPTLYILTNFGIKAGKKNTSEVDKRFELFNDEELKSWKREWNQSDTKFTKFKQFLTFVGRLN